MEGSQKGTIHLRTRQFLRETELAFQKKKKKDKPKKHRLHQQSFQNYVFKPISTPLLPPVRRHRDNMEHAILALLTGSDTRWST